MNKWEYHILDVFDLKLPILDRRAGLAQLQQHLNELGQQGWEHTGSALSSDNKTLLFKRPITC